MNDRAESTSNPSSQSDMTRAATSHGNHWVQIAPTFADWDRQEYPPSQGYRGEIELDTDAGGVALQFARERGADSDGGEIFGGWREQLALEGGSVIRAHFQTDYLGLNPDGTVLKAEGYLSVNKPFVPTTIKTGELAPVGSSITLSAFIPEDGDYRVRVLSRFENSDVTTERPSGASRVFITVEQSIVMQGPGQPVGV